MNEKTNFVYEHHTICADKMMNMREKHDCTSCWCSFSFWICMTFAIIFIKFEVKKDVMHPRQKERRKTRVIQFPFMAVITVFIMWCKHVQPSVSHLLTRQMKCMRQTMHLANGQHRENHFIIVICRSKFRANEFPTPGNYTILPFLPLCRCRGDNFNWTVCQRVFVYGSNKPRVVRDGHVISS